MKDKTKNVGKDFVLKEEDMTQVVQLIDEVILNFENDEILESIAEKVNEMMADRSLFTW